MVVCFKTVCPFREILEEMANLDGLEIMDPWAFRWVERNTDVWQNPEEDLRLLFNCLRVWQGEPGPQGADGDKGERGDDVSDNPSVQQQK